MLIVENLLELFEEEDAAGLPLEIRLKILHLAADAQLSRREPALAVLVLEKMNKIINEKSLIDNRLFLIITQCEITSGSTVGRMND